MVASSMTDRQIKTCSADVCVAVSSWRWKGRRAHTHTHTRRANHHGRNERAILPTTEVLQNSTELCWRSGGFMNCLLNPTLVMDVRALIRMVGIDVRWRGLTRRVTRAPPLAPSMMIRSARVRDLYIYPESRCARDGSARNNGNCFLIGQENSTGAYTEIVRYRGENAESTVCQHTFSRHETWPTLKCDLPYNVSPCVYGITTEMV